LENLAKKPKGGILPATVVKKKHDFLCSAEAEFWKNWGDNVKQIWDLP